MLFFFDADRQGNGTDFRVTPMYFELTTASSDPPGTSTLYVGPGPLPCSLTIRACWGRDLETWLPQLTDPERGSDWIRVFCNTYPTIGRMWEAAEAGEFGETVLIRDIDPDDMKWKWFAQRSVGNVTVPSEVSRESAIELLTHPKLVAGYRALLNDSFAACHELLTRKLGVTDLTQMLGKEYVRSQLKVLRRASEWAPRLTAVFGD